MSYCRWSEGDVYAYESCEGGVRFWVAGDDIFNRLCDTYNEAYQYAKELRDKHGFDVPSHAIEALRKDAIDEAKRYQGPDSAVADMLSENAELRKLVLDVHAIGWSGFDCTECPVSFSGRCENNGGCNWLGILTDRMHELGIEVPE